MANLTLYNIFITMFTISHHTIFNTIYFINIQLIFSLSQSFLCVLMQSVDPQVIQNKFCGKLLLTKNRMVVMICIVLKLKCIREFGEWQLGALE